MTRHTALLAALLVSVAVNLLIAGIFLGRLGAPRDEPPPAAWAARELTPETRDRVRRYMRERLPEVRPLRRDMREARLAVRAALSARDLDPAALGDALARLRDAGNRYEEFIHANLVDLATSLPRGEREALIRAALERRPEGPRRPRRPPG